MPYSLEKDPQIKNSSFSTNYDNELETCLKCGKMMRFEETDTHYFECILEKHPGLIKDKWMKFYEAGFKEGQRYILRV